MEKSELLERLSGELSVGDIQKIFSELKTSADSGLGIIKGVLAEFAADSGQLSDEAVRRQLKWIYLYAGLNNLSDALPDFLALVMAPGFAEAVPENDWIICEISHLFGVISGEGATEALEALIVNGNMGRSVREQLFMTQVFRWIAKKDSDEVFGGVITRLMANLPGDFATPELMMAIIVNAVAVHGNSAREQVLNFYKEHESSAGDMLSLANIRNFFDIGRPQLKAMMVENYMGMYDKEEVEIQRALDYVPDSRNVIEKHRTTKPIVREEPKIGRNDLCPCGSGKKYKKCCGK